jgi:hypothetical protein
MFYRANLVDVSDTYKNALGCWEVNGPALIEEDIYWREDAITTRSILEALRKWGYLSQSSKGKVEVIYNNWPYIELVVRGSQRPLYRLDFDEEGIEEEDLPL